MKNDHEFVLTKQKVDLEQRLSDFIGKSKSVFILCDSNTLKDCWPVVAGFACLKDANIIELEPGEENKSLEICAHIWMSLQENRADRYSIIINLGGGVISDIGGFIASTYKRGIGFVNLPTSLIGMVDAALGGKTGINLGNSKNQIGTFTQPDRLIINSGFLETLPELELMSGFAEMIKHGLISNSNHWLHLSALKEISAHTVSPFIEESLKIKQEIVREDPLEKGLRKSLNFGHSIGHAIEGNLLSKGEHITHGHAIALGMYIETILSTHLTLLPEDSAKVVQEFIEQHYDLALLTKLDPKELWDLVEQDKKNKGGQVLMTLLKEIGEVAFDVPVLFEDFKSIFISK